MTEATKTKTAKFSLEAYILDRVTSPEVAAQMAQAVAFATTNFLRARARAATKAVEEADQGLTTHLIKSQFKAAGDDPIQVEQELLVDLENIVKEIAQGDDFMSDSGHEPGAIPQLFQAIELRERWEEIAITLTGMTVDYRGNPRKFKATTHESVIAEAYMPEISSTEQSRLKLAVTKEAARKGLSVQATNELFKERLAKRQAVIDAQNAERAFEAEYQALVFGALAQAGSACVNQALPTDFWELPADTRASMIQAAIRGAKRAEMYATSDRNLTEDQFSLIVEEVARVESQLEAVLGSARGALTTDIQAKREALRAKLDI